MAAFTLSLDPCSVPQHFFPSSSSPSPSSLVHQLHFHYRNQPPSPSPLLCKKGKFCSSLRTAAARHLKGSRSGAEGLRFGVVVAQFDEDVTSKLLDGALNTFRKCSVREEDIDVVWVPSSFEIGVVTEKLGKSGKYDAILCTAAVIKDNTSHYDAVVNSAASGVLSAGLNSGVPCIFGVLTCDDMDQALNRAGGKSGNKGSEAAEAAIKMASLFKHHLHKRFEGQS